MNYAEATDYLFNQIPMYERDGKTGYKEGLSNTLAFDEHFDHPHRDYKTIHIGGTNGKGSCSHTIAAVLQSCGYCVGLYTSPHILDFSDRIKVNGENISERYVTEFVNDNKDFIDSLHPSFFEVTTAMAFKYFKDKNVDIAVIEVGLGGRLDCTNIITPILSVITNISFDHTQYLGDTLEKIAEEKAGIIKRNVPVVIGENDEHTHSVFERKAKEMDAPIVFAEDDKDVLDATLLDNGGIRYKTKWLGEVNGDLSGAYQIKNMNTVIKALQQLAAQGYIADRDETDDWENATSSIKYAIGNVAPTTGLLGRWQVIKNHPMVVCDAGHNAGGWAYLSKQLEAAKCDKLHIVFGMVDDKDIDSVMELMPKNAVYYFTSFNSKRAIDEGTLAQKAKAHGLYGNSFASVDKAYKTALKMAKDNDLVFVGGSCYVVADFLNFSV